MTRFAVPVLALMLAGLPGLLDAQQRGGGMMGMMQGVNPLEAVLQRADSLQLSLTAEQTTRLTALKEGLEETNRPHQAEVTRLIGLMAGGPDPSLFQEIQTHTQAIQRENQAALQRARDEVFTAEQWPRVEAYVQTLQPQGRGGGRGDGFPG